MEPLAYTEPDPARVHDPLAVALGNASLLGIGYLMLGRRRLAVAAGAVTVLLISVLVSIGRSWFEVVVLLWWAAVIAHGWSLAGGRTRRVAVRRQRLIALGVTVPVLLAVGLLRFDTSRIERSVAEARGDGDCARVLTAQGGVWLGDRIADAPLSARGDRAAAACDRLRTARAKLTTGLTGDTGALKAGFDILAAVLADPGNDRTVDVALNGFLGGLPTADPCHTAAVTDWLRARQPSHNALDRSAGVAARTAPAALLGCGAALMKTDDWQQARARYQQVLDQYPGNELTGRARDGVTQATQAIELANVRSLLDGPTDEKPEYCSAPAKYSGAAPYRKGTTNRALFYGNDQYTKKLPAGWRTTDPAHAVLVVCADDEDYGARVQTCFYTGKFPGLSQVTFRKVAIPVKVYELRTGKRVAHRKVQITGSSCPRRIHYTTFGTSDLGPGPDEYVHPSKANVRAAFSSLIKR